MPFYSADVSRAQKRERTGKGDLAIIAPEPKAYEEVARAHVLEGKRWTTPVLADSRVYARSTKEAVCLHVAGR